MALSADESSTRQKLALIIGNGNYTESKNRLTHSARNARAVRDLLKTAGFDVGDTYTDIPTDTKMKGIVCTFAERIRDGDLVLFYFSGRGCEVDDQRYLIPTEDDRIETEREVLDCATNVKRTLERLVEKNTSYVTISILDCCRPYWLRADRTPSSSIKDKSFDCGPLIQLISCTDGMLDDVRQRNHRNLFQHHLLRNIDQENVPIIEVLERIKNETYRESKRKQRPLIIDELHRHRRVYINEVIYFPTSISPDATWKTRARTVAGARGYQSAPGSTSDKLHYPRGLSITQNNTMLIADTLNHRIMKYSHSAELGQRIAGKNMSGSASHLLWAPSSVVYHKQSRSFIIADCHNRRVMRRPRGRHGRLEILLENIQCFGLAVDNEGSLYVSDTGNHLVRRYRIGSRRGTVVAGGHGEGRRLHQLSHPTYIFVAENKSIFVSDSSNDRVMKWEAGANEGVVVAGGNGKGKNRTQLDRPAGLFVDRLGAVYVADHCNHRVMRWRAGEPHGEIIAGNRYLSGDAADKLNGPEGLAFDEHGNLYVADAFNHRVQRFAIKR